MARRSDLNADKSLLALEHLERGNLTKWIQKLNSENVDFYDRQLWLIADCREFPARIPPILPTNEPDSR